MIRSHCSRRAVALASLLLFASGATAGGARAQERSARDGTPPSPPAGSVVGSVVDAASGLPLPDARVALSAVPIGVLPAAGSPFVTVDRAVTTDSLGTYRFAGLAPGDYALRVQRMGYRPALLQVTLRASGSSLVSVGMTVVPVRLEVVEVRALADGAPARGAAGVQPPGARVATERLRQRRYLSADVRALTAGDVQESLTLAETDLFRALQRLPGVEARDGYSADLLTRGARGDGTRVYFDGVPLIDPLHAYGGLSSVAVDAVGAAFLHPGVRPAALGEGGAAVVDLRTRTGATDSLRGVAEVSVISARAALDRRAQDARWAWMVAGRSTYSDRSTHDIRWVGITPQRVLPHHFSDLAARGDLRLGRRSALETSAILTNDALTRRIAVGQPYMFGSPPYFRPDTLGYDGRTHRGSGAGRLTLATPVGALATRFTAGVSRYDAGVRVGSDATQLDILSGSERLPMRMTVTHALLSGLVEPERSVTRTSSGAPAPWSAGYDVVRRDGRFRGPALGVFGHDLTSADTTIASSLTTLALWGERRWKPSERLELQTGGRLESGQRVKGAESLRAAPRLAARYQLSPNAAISAAAGRSFQYTQALLPTALGTGAVTYPSRLWLVAGRDVPALRTDVATLGVERWLGARWLASANAYVRSGEGMILSDPRPGELVARPLFVTGGEWARGVELAARRLEGRWTGSLAYSYARAEMHASGLRFPSPYERRHSVDATWMLRLRPSLRLGAAYSQSTGAPYTRTYIGSIGDTTSAGVYAWRVPPRAESPYAERQASGATADVLVDWSRKFRSWELGAFLQLHGTFQPSQSILYSGTTAYLQAEPTSVSCTTNPAPAGCIRQDMGDTPYPLVPVVGLRVSF